MYLILILLTLPSSLASSSSGFDPDPTSDGADSSGDIQVQLCAGRAPKSFCHSNLAIEQRDCPSTCLPDHCASSSESKHSKDIQKGLFDFVYVRRDTLCVRKCDRGGSCFDWNTHNGDIYCNAIQCSSSDIDGCHGGSDFDTPTCEDCVWIFPNACRSSFSDSVDRSFDVSGSESSSSSQRRLLDNPEELFLLNGPMMKKWSRFYTITEWNQWAEWNPWFKESKWAHWGEWNGTASNKTAVLLIASDGTIVSKLTIPFP